MSGELERDADETDEIGEPVDDRLAVVDDHAPYVKSVDVADCEDEDDATDETEDADDADDDNDDGDASVTVGRGSDVVQCFWPSASMYTLMGRRIAALSFLLLLLMPLRSPADTYGATTVGEIAPPDWWWW